MRNKFAAAKKFVQDRKPEITAGVACTAMLVIAMQHSALKDKDAFLAEHNLLDAYYKYGEE